MRIARLAATAALTVAALLACGSPLRAEKFAADVPSDALVYVQWAGSDSLGPAYAGSHAKAMLDAFKLQTLVSGAMARQQPGGNLALQRSLVDLLQTVSHAPGALYVGPMEFSDPDKPSVKLALFSKVGHDKAVSLAAALSAGISHQPHKEGDPPVAAVAVNDFLLLTVGADIDIEKRLAAPQPSDLASTDNYKTTVGHVTEGGAEPAVLLYINGEAALRTVDDAVAAKAPPQQSRGWPMVEAAMNLDALQSIALAGNFDGPDWTTKGFIGLAENRAGVAAFLDNAALPDTTLALVPANATWVSVSRFDGPRFLDDMRNAIANIPGAGGGGGQKRFDMGLQQVFAFTGVDVKRDLLPSLGDAYILYGTPDAAGHSLTNLTMVSPLKNAQKAETSLNTLEQFINAMVGQRDPTSRINFKTEKLPAPNDQFTVHTLSLTTIAPSWTIANGNLYFSLTKEGVVQALTDAAKHSSLTANPAYAEARKHIAQPALSRMTFFNIPAVAPELYDLLAQAFAKHKAEHPKEVGDYELPPLSALTPLFTPSIAGSWTDAAGWHVQIHGDSPAALIVPPTTIVVSQAARREREAPAPAPTTAPAALP